MKAKFPIFNAEQETKVLKKFSEKKAKEAKNFDWETHPELFDEEKLYYTKEEKELIKQLLLHGPIPSKYRKEFWLISTGAKLECKNNPGYYEKLVGLIEKFPECPHFEEINNYKNLKYPQDSFFAEEKNSEAVIKILKAFALRSSISIGYKDGFIFIVTRLLNELEEEEKAFWCFAKIIEDYLPLDYYINIYGLLIDIGVIDSIISESIEDNQHINVIGLKISEIIGQCFDSLFAQNVNLETLKNIWDVFVICGDVTLFRAFYFYATQLIKKDLNELPEPQDFLDKQFNEIKPSDRLIYYLLADSRIDDSLIKQRRKEEREKEKEKEEKEKEKKEKEKKDKVAFDKSQIKKKCDTNTPYCFYNEKIIRDDLHPDYEIFKVKKNTEKNEDYFTNLFKENKFSNNNGRFIKNENPGGNFDDILVERVEHVCPKENQEAQKDKKE